MKWIRISTMKPGWKKIFGSTTIEKVLNFDSDFFLLFLSFYFFLTVK